MKFKNCLTTVFLILFTATGYSSAQSLKVTTEGKMIKAGEFIRASATVRNDLQKEIEWIFVASLLSKNPKVPVPRDFLKKFKLGPGKEQIIQISLPTEGLIYDGEYQLICDLFDEARNPIAKDIKYISVVGGKKRLYMTLKTCKDKECTKPARMFVLGEKVHIIYYTNVEFPQIKALLFMPDQSTATLKLPTTIVVKQAGDYQLTAYISKQGYRTEKKFLMFGVIEPSHKLNMPLKLKQIE